MAKLRLHRETLAELTPGELASMGGAQAPWTPVVLTLPLDQCVTAKFQTITKCIDQTLSLTCPSEYPSCLCTPPA